MVWVGCSLSGQECRCEGAGASGRKRAAVPWVSECRLLANWGASFAVGLLFEFELKMRAGHAVCLVCFVASFFAGLLAGWCARVAGFDFAATRALVGVLR